MHLHKEDMVETKVIIADRSISPLNMTVQLLEADPPGEQPYINKANDSIGGRLNILIKAYDNRGISTYCDKKPMITAIGILIILINESVSSKIPIMIDITHEKKTT